MGCPIENPKDTTFLLKKFAIIFSGAESILNIP
jgi:hypothetical protein